MNDQLEENEYHSNSIIELPITIQKNIKIETCSSSSNSSSSPSASLNKSNNSNNSFKWCNIADSNNIIDSSRQKSNLGELYIEDVNDNENFVNNKNSSKYHQHTNIIKSRQNIVSTYEICNDCFDNNLLMSNPNNGQSNSKCCNNNHNNNNQCKNKILQNLSDFSNNNNKSSSPVNFISNNNNKQGTTASTTTTVYNHLINPIKFNNSYSNQDLTKISNQTNSVNNEIYQQNRSRSVLGQINESVVQDTVNKNNKQTNSLARNTATNNGSKASNSANGDFKSNSNGNISSSGNNGNVISQKVFSIGLPVNSSLKNRTGEQSPSPKMNDFKSEFFI